jgi:putative endonuclease
MNNQFYVYFITNKHNSVIYTGFSDDLYRRIIEHKEKLNPGFSKKYNCNKLVYYEEFDNAEEALQRERQLKRYKRKWKEDLINSMNPSWRDFIEDFIVNN